jgi:inhibitor of KinA sporulation pathway (predicted exonuclease)
VLVLPFGTSFSSQIVAEFHEYVRPIYVPRLSRFCTRTFSLIYFPLCASDALLLSELTGITQEMVDPADPFAEVRRTLLLPS